MSHHALLLLLMLPGCINVQDQIDLDGDTGTPRPDDQDTEDPVDTVDTQDAETPIPFCINEIMADNRGAFQLPTGETPDWFELHNPTADELRLVGWQVSDTQNPELWASLDEIVLAPEAFVVLYADGAGVPGPRHLNFELSSEGDSIVIRAPDGRRMTVNFPASAQDMSYARRTDCCEGESCWEAMPYGSPERSNGGQGPVDTGP